MLITVLAILAFLVPGCAEDEGDTDADINVVPADTDDEINGTPTYTVPVFAHNQSVFTEKELMAVIHTDYRYAGEFYTENFTGVSISYVKSPYVKNAKNETEYSTDDRDVAYNLSKTGKGVLVNETQTEKYFQFEYPKNSYGKRDIVRVHKESYVNRTNMTHRFSGQYAGTFNVRPMTAENIDEVIEYLFRMTEGYYHLDESLLSSFTVDEEDAWVHHMYIMDADQADNGSNTWYFHVYHASYTVDKDTGRILYYCK